LRAGQSVRRCNVAQHKRNAVLDALSGSLAPTAPAAAEVVHLNPAAQEAAPAAAELVSEPMETPAAAPARKVPQQRAKAATRSGPVATTYKRVSLYLPPAAKRKFEEIAFTEERKEHDVYIEILRDWLKKKGHPGLL